jgi:hypothetical protein
MSALVASASITTSAFDGHHRQMVCLPVRARWAIFSIVSAPYPTSATNSAAAARIACLLFSLRSQDRLDKATASEDRLHGHLADAGDAAAISAVAAAAGPVDQLIVTVSGGERLGALAYFAAAAEALPARQIATADQIAEVVVLAAASPNITGTVMETDAGARLVTLG